MLLFWVVVETEVHFFPLHDESQNPEKIYQDAVPLHNDRVLVTLLLILVGSCEKTINAVDPDSKHVKGK